MYQYGQYVPDYNSFGRPQMPNYQRQEIVHVNGKNGAEAYQMAPNSNCLLLDDTAPIVWLKQTDGAGYPQLTPYTITPYKPEPQVNTSDILDRIQRLEDKIYGKPNASDAPSKGKREQ